MIVMDKNFTTIEQSKKLLELGITANSADCYWEQCSDSLIGDWEYKCFVGKSSSIKNNLFSFRNGYTVPCWSLGNLIKIYISCIGSIFLDSSRFVEKESLVDIIISIFEQKIQEDQFNFTKLEK